MPFCGLNTWPRHCALVSAAISSNLATLNWILCKGPSVLWERHTLFSEQRAFSGALVFWIAPGLTSQTGTAGLTFHFLLATGKRSIPRGAGSPLSLLCCTSTTHPPQQMWLTPVTEWSHSRSDVHTQSNKTPTSYIHNHSKMESWVSDLLLSFNLLDDIPLARDWWIFRASFIPLSQPEHIVRWRKSNWNCGRRKHSCV